MLVRLLSGLQPNLLFSQESMTVSLGETFECYKKKWGAHTRTQNGMGEDTRLKDTVSAVCGIEGKKETKMAEVAEEDAF